MDSERKWWWCQIHGIVDFCTNYDDEWTAFICLAKAEFPIDGECEQVQVEEPKKVSREA